jgi:hypothetical protein
MEEGEAVVGGSSRSAICGWLRVGKENLHVAGCQCGQVFGLSTQLCNSRREGGTNKDTSARP